MDIISVHLSNMRRDAWSHKTSLTLPNEYSAAVNQRTGSTIAQ